MFWSQRATPNSQNLIYPQRDIGELTPDGGWCWFHEPRFNITGSSVWVGAVSSGWRDPKQKGQVVAVQWDRGSGKVRRHVLHNPADAEQARVWANDHSAPALLILPSGAIIAAYSLHGTDNQIRVRKYHPLLRVWSREKRFRPSEQSRVTYSNLVYLSKERRLYNFFRGLDGKWKPSWSYSDNYGRSWKAGGILIDFPHIKTHRPYLKVASNGRDLVHFAYTEGHPRDYVNSIFHAVYKSGVGIMDSSGTPIASLETGMSSPDQGTIVTRGRPDRVPWVIAVNDFGPGGLYILYSVRIGSPRMTRGSMASDLEYFIAQWNGETWTNYFVAHAGPQLYLGEDDYSGLFSQQADNPKVVYISTRVCPLTSKKLRYWEIFQGSTVNFLDWSWTPLTHQSKEDNIRPICVPGTQPTLLWLRGKMKSYSSFSLRVTGKELESARAHEN